MKGTWSQRRVWLAELGMSHTREGGGSVFDMCMQAQCPGNTNIPEDHWYIEVTQQGVKWHIRFASSLLCLQSFAAAKQHQHRSRKSFFLKKDSWRMSRLPQPTTGTRHNIASWSCCLLNHRYQVQHCIMVSLLTQSVFVCMFFPWSSPSDSSPHHAVFLPDSTRW